MSMSKEEIEELAIEAAAAEVTGYRFGENGREPLYGIPTETDDGSVYYEKFELPEWLTRFAELLVMQTTTGNKMANLKVTLEIEIPDTDATYEQIRQFVWFYICQEGSIGRDNPLYDAEYEIKDFSVD